MTTKHLFRAGGLVVMAGGAVLLHASSRMPYATSLGPGPGFFPYWLSALLLLLGGAMLVQTLVEAPAELPEEFWPAEGGVARLLTVLAAVAIAALGLQEVGFAPVMLVVNLMVLFVLGFRRPLPLVAVALAGSFGVYFLFTRLLGVQLPAGLLSS